MTTGEDESRREEGAAGKPDRPSWAADKTVHATVDSINAAVGAMIAEDGGLPPVVPPGTSDAGEAEAVDAGAAGAGAAGTGAAAGPGVQAGPPADKKAHASA